MRTLPLWILGTLVGAAIFHILTVLAVPYMQMGLVLNGVDDLGGNNAAIHNAPPTAADRTVVRPSPDLAYSVCTFDLDEGPLLMTARIPDNTYWSVSVFARNTDNFFAANDQDIDADSVSFIIKREDDELPGYDRVPVIYSPSARGLVLFRTLVEDEASFAKADPVRRAATCQTLTQH